MANEALEKLAKLGAVDKLAAAVASKIEEVENSIPTKTSDLTNDSTFQTQSEVTAAIAAQISRVYKPSGTLPFADLPTPSAENLGNVYNMSDDFTSDNRFVDGAGGKYSAGVNVGVVLVGEDYKFDVLSMPVDLSGYVQKDGNKVLSTNDFTDDDKSKLDGIAANATKVEASTTAGNIKVNGTEVKVVDIASDEEAQAVIDAHFPASV